MEKNIHLTTSINYSSQRMMIRVEKKLEIIINYMSFIDKSKSLIKRFHKKIGLEMTLFFLKIKNILNYLVY